MLVKSLLFKLLVVNCMIYATCSYANEPVCRPLLWPFNINQSSLNPDSAEINELTVMAKKALKSSINPVKTITTAGVTNAKNVDLLKSRLALQDSDNAAVLALMYTFNKNPDYLNKVRSVLLEWSELNIPTGNPIDETRLEGMIWAYDLVSCHLSQKDRKTITTWLKLIETKKRSWVFQQKTLTNNHRINQLKILLLLDKIFQNSINWKNDLETAKELSLINLNPSTGESIDYLQRHALYYHNYDLTAWLEICIINNSCFDSVMKAYDFLIHKIRSHEIYHEFQNSTAKIDHLRDLGGFDYAKENSRYNITRTSPAIIAYYTLNKTKPDDDLWNIVELTKPTPNLAFLKVRKLLWNHEN